MSAESVGKVQDRDMAQDSELASEEPVTRRGVAVPIDYRVPEDFVSRYATHIVVQHLEHEFMLSFFEVRPPLLVGAPEKIREDLAHLDSVRAECVARIIVSEGELPRFIAALQENYDRYVADREAAE
jgi:hypothetical protein